jgi:hypothetical protein
MLQAAPAARRGMQVPSTRFGGALQYDSSEQPCKVPSVDENPQLPDESAIFLQVESF